MKTIPLTNLSYLIKESYLLSHKYKDKKEQENAFNIFSVLRKESDEVYLHSRFLSALIDLHAPHKMGSIFLDSFLEIINSNFNYSPKSFESYPNYNFHSEYKDIDILLIDRQYQNAIIIENKIFHCDTNHETEGQLEKYYRIIAEDEGIPEEKIEVIYLTIDGHEPSDESVNTKGSYPQLNTIVKSISYGIEIIKWLKECAKECFNKPSIRESIIQYLNLIETMTNNDISIEERIALVKLIGKNDDNLEGAKFLLDNFKHVQLHTLIDFWNELKNEAELRNYEIISSPSEDDIRKLVHGGPIQRKVSLDLTFLTDEEIPFSIVSDYDDWIYWGISSDEFKKHHNKTISAKSIKEFVKASDEYDSEENEYWLFSSYLSLSEDEDVCCSDFSCDGTFKLITPSYRQQIITIIFEELEKFKSSYMAYRNKK